MATKVISDVVQILTAYGPRPDVPGVFCPPEEGMTKQSFKDECDINVIMARYEKTGVMPDFGGRDGRYMDCTGSDFRVAMETVAQGKSMFAELPAHVRARFNNDPAQMLDFVADGRNREEALELGLLKPREEWATPAVPAEPVAPKTGKAAVKAAAVAAGERKAADEGEPSA